MSDAEHEGYFKCRLQNHNMTGKDAYKYFVVRAQEIAISKNWTPVNWYVDVLPPAGGSWFSHCL